MNPFKTSKHAKAAVIALSLMATPFSMSAFAQTTTSPERVGTTEAVVTEDDDGNWGWLGLLGLIGLAGLAGLRRKNDRGVVTHSTSRP
nr:MYXO-CTERM sorting domain-containing protein [Gammaproteobacteria bacterium]